MARHWLNAAVLLGLCGFGVALAAHRSPAPVSAPSDEIARLEQAFALDSGDAGAAQSLMRAYLERDTPGLAVSVVQRAPAAALATPASTDLASRALLGAGRATESLAVTRQIVNRCEAEGCDASLIARAARREQILTAMVEMGIEDADRDPAAVELALRRSTRQVRLAMVDQ
jgi:hypothetical protein